VKYSIEIGKIVEGALNHDQTKVINFTKQLIKKLETDNEQRVAKKFLNLLESKSKTALVAMSSKNEIQIPVDSESRNALADIIYPSENNIEVVLSRRNENNLQSYINSYKNADKLNSLGLGISNTLLLHGPPGCGKTKCAYLIAKEINLPLVVARLDSIISSYLGTTAKNIRSLFEFAQQTPCVLFLDEFDAIAKARDDHNELGELKRVVNSLIQNIDAMSPDSLLIAATNHESLLDTAVWRRFGYSLKIEIPDYEATSKLISLFLGDLIKLNEKDKSILTLFFSGLSGATIEEVIKRSLRDSIIHNIEPNISIFFDSIFDIKNTQKVSENDNRALTTLKVQYLRNLSDKIFSYAEIARVMNISKTTVARLLTEEGDVDG
jgi:SpoVK/Ycf46/Vps4 family AAA+-type ATPase